MTPAARFFLKRRSKNEDWQGGSIESFGSPGLLWGWSGMLRRCGTPNSLPIHNFRLYL